MMFAGRGRREGRRDTHTFCRRQTVRSHDCPVCMIWVQHLSWHLCMRRQAHLSSHLRMRRQVFDTHQTGCYVARTHASCALAGMHAGVKGEEQEEVSLISQPRTQIEDGVNRSQKGVDHAWLSSRSLTDAHVHTPPLTDVY